MTWTSATTDDGDDHQRQRPADWRQEQESGRSNITATPGSGVTSPVDVLTVTAAALQSIAVAPVNPSIAKGATQQFTATGTYSDNSTANITSSVTWSSATTTTATILSTTGRRVGNRSGSRDQ